MNEKQGRSVWTVLQHRVIIVFLWLTIFALFLYVPNFILRMFSENTLHVFTYTELISAESLNEFTAKTGIAVKVTHFERDEEMFAKISLSRGKDYDIVLSVDYMAEYLVKAGLVAPLDRSKISNFASLDPRLLGQYYDPDNRYSLPYSWGVHGLAYDKEFFGKNLDGYGWELIFENQPLGDPSIPAFYNVCMADTPKDVVGIAAKYYFGSVAGMTRLKLEQLLPMLKKQYKFVSVYNSDKPEYLLSIGIAEIAVTISGYMRKLEALGENNKYGFFIPRQGSVIAIENVLIPVLSNKKDLAHQFIDFLLSPKVHAYNSNLYGFNPVNLQAVPLIDEKIVKDPHWYPHGEMFNKLEVLRNDVSMQDLDHFWLSVKMEK